MGGAQPTAPPPARCGGAPPAGRNRGKAALRRLPFLHSMVCPCALPCPRRFPVLHPAPLRATPPQAAAALSSPRQAAGGHGAARGPGLRGELGNVVLLVVLYMLQGVPLGLSMGSM